MNEYGFNNNDLSACDYQYQVCHNSSGYFEVGQVVFLKSEPKSRLVVVGVSEGEVEVLYDLNNSKTVMMPPECLLQYEFAGLMVWLGWEVCFN